MQIEETTRDDRGTPITRNELTKAEELYVRKLEKMALLPSDFLRFPDGSLTFGASKKQGVCRSRRPGSVSSSDKKHEAQ